MFARDGVVSLGVASCTMLTRDNSSCALTLKEGKTLAAAVDQSRLTPLNKGLPKVKGKSTYYISRVGLAAPDRETSRIA